MRATFALLTPRPLENRFSKLGWDINLRWKTGVQARCLAPHISLKQPFHIGDNLGLLEAYMATFATSIPPFQVELKDFRVWESFFVVHVEETPILRDLHNRLNRELPPLFGDVSALFDGDDYQFHLTVTSGNVPAETYREIYAVYAETPVRETFLASELAMFVFNERAPNLRDYMTHTVLPLTG